MTRTRTYKLAAVSSWLIIAGPIMLGLQYLISLASRTSGQMLVALAGWAVVMAIVFYLPRATAVLVDGVARELHEASGRRKGRDLVVLLVQVDREQERVLDVLEDTSSETEKRRHLDVAKVSRRCQDEYARQLLPC